MSRKNKFLNVILALSVYLFCLQADAYVDRNIVVKGELKSLGEKISEITTETGTVNVPSDAVRANKYRPGQSVMLFVDIADFLDFNKDKLAKIKETKAVAEKATPKREQ